MLDVREHPTPTAGLPAPETRGVRRTFLRQLPPLGWAGLYCLPFLGIGDLSAAGAFLIWGLFLCMEIVRRRPRTLQGPLHDLRQIRSIAGTTQSGATQVIINPIAIK